MSILYSICSFHCWTFPFYFLQADADKDGHLTLSEMIDSPYVFYSAIFNEDEDDDYEYHDEFR